MHADSLHMALQRAGHEVERIQLPFKFSPESDIERLMAFCEGLDLSRPNGQSVDRLISLQFPGYGLQHPHHVAWVLHQHRAVYELYDESTANEPLRKLREAVRAYDARALRAAKRVFANSRRVAERLLHFSGMHAQPLYHPPPHAERFFSAEAWNYVFFPSRLESLKRQDLLIKAAALMNSPIKVLISGSGGQEVRYRELVGRLGLAGRVELLGTVSEAEKRVLYAHALGVVFVPHDEDLGYVTLEAMCARKPVITCTDSGGPLEFVVHGETGWVVEPTPEALADAIETLWAHRPRARSMGEAGHAHLRSLDLNWDKVVEALCA